MYFKVTYIRSTGEMTGEICEGYVRVEGRDECIAKKRECL
jgi:hypothetical protein